MKTTTKLSDLYVQTHKVSAGYKEIARGHFVVEDDGYKYVYAKRGNTISEIRRLIRNAYAEGPSMPVRITGRYPHYTVEPIL